MTSNSSLSFLKLSGVPNCTSSNILPNGYVGFSGVIPGNRVSVGFRLAKEMCIFVSVSAYIRLMLLPPSINILGTSYPSITAGNTSADCPGLGTCGGWSSFVNPIGWSDQLRYSTVGGGDVTAMLTCLVISFCALLLGLPF